MCNDNDERDGELDEELEYIPPSLGPLIITVIAKYQFGPERIRFSCAPNGSMFWVAAPGEEIPGFGVTKDLYSISLTTNRKAINIEESPNDTNFIQ